MNNETSIAQLNVGMKDLTIEAVILEVGQITFVEGGYAFISYKIGDETASVNLALWGCTDNYFKVGEIMRISNGHVVVHWHQLTLYTKMLDVQKVGKYCMVFEENLNMSDITFPGLPNNPDQARVSLGVKQVRPGGARSSATHDLETGGFMSKGIIIERSWLNSMNLETSIVCCSIAQLKFGMKDVTIQAVIIAVGRRTFVEGGYAFIPYQIADGTASVNLALWGCTVNYFKAGEIIRISSGQVVLQQHQLTLYSKLLNTQKVGQYCMVFEETLNMSDITFPEPFAN